MEFPFCIKRLCDFNSNLIYLFIVVHLALLQIAAGRAFSLLRAVFEAKLSFLQHHAHHINALIAHCDGQSTSLPQ